MKKVLLLLALGFSVTQLWSQKMVSSDNQYEQKGNKAYNIPLIGDPAPSFTARSTNGIVNFPGDYGHSWKILFSHPADYTPVCTTEIMELAYLQDEFDRIGVKVVVVSTDKVETHIRWKKDMEGITFKDRKQIDIKFPIVGDENLSISKKYGMIHPATSSTKAVRGVFIIDPDNKVAAVLFYPMNVGRSTDELLRMVTALQTTSADNVCTPVNWKAGDDVLIPYNPTPTKDLANPGVLQPEGYYNLAWFVWYKKSN
jgi:peroxiredoxin (alkyl hydroperoxide reductase subunit C)